MYIYIDSVLIRQGRLFVNISLVLTFCVNSTRGRGGHEPPRWIKTLGKEKGEPTIKSLSSSSSNNNRTFGSHPLRTLSSPWHGDNTDPATASWLTS